MNDGNPSGGRKETEKGKKSHTSLQVPKNSSQNQTSLGKIPSHKAFETINETDEKNTSSDEKDFIKWPQLLKGLFRVSSFVYLITRKVDQTLMNIEVSFKKQMKPTKLILSLRLIPQNKNEKNSAHVFI